ncbi:hypothetical protein [Streptomyces sp. 5-10]|uniref:hypothetical protein n=1 Tax=Streptomyces sp. 5-10 TaxID=878925 RepID=UPI0021DF6978|nr:hypothetical protein [Streptomyces sp. 5-10]
MQVMPEEGQLLTLLAGLTPARGILEMPRRGTPTPKGSARSTRWSATTPAWRCR